MQEKIRSHRHSNPPPQIKHRMDKSLGVFQPSSVSDALYPIARSLLFRLDPEIAHDLSMKALRLSEKIGVLRLFFPDDEYLRPVELMGIRFPNRVGLAAGLDKEGNTIGALGRLGFGSIEIGTITPRPQSGNPRPRLFRLVPHEAVINRMGFNNPGIHEGVHNVKRTRGFNGVIGFNIGKNKDTPNENAVDDYLICLREAYMVADYIAVNLSSPNTPGLRELQGAEASARLLEALKSEQQKLAATTGKYTPLLFKVAPDLEDGHIRALSKVFLDGGLDGLIATNTTLDRDAVAGHPYAAEAGGLSGRPVREKSNHVLASFSSEFSKKIPIIGVGGISSVDDAQDKLRLGASIVQIYTSFIYQGPPLVRSLAREL